MDRAGLPALGWDAAREAESAPHAAAGLVPGRIVAMHRGALILQEAGGRRTSEASGALRHRIDAAGPEGRPAVGDWVMSEPSGQVQVILERRGALTRTDERGTGEVLAANVDLVLVVASLNRDLNERRIERMLALARDGGAHARLVLSKADLQKDPQAIAAEVGDRVGEEPLLLATKANVGLDAVRALLAPRATTALLGSSGVGKSTLLNALLGEEHQRTLEIRASDDRGRHATTHRELFLLADGGLVLDTPGLRLPRIAGSEGLAETFGDIEALAERCAFNDCAHDSEPGCAVQDAIESGELDAARLEAYRGLQREALTAAQRRGRARVAADRRPAAAERRTR